ncbi:MAG: gliding motility-associated C-terminal domain-containing protein [Flavobacteriales bacterium]|nr:gliding motility-associated C-terminal domain-containing protein [Flavobacteriales bacterium]
MSKSSFDLLIKNIHIFVLLIITISSSAQNEFNNWYFGNGCGITFNNNNVRAISGSSLYTEEGSASISDQDGNLLFYTNGVLVWDRNHEVMPNGRGLLGHVSSTQAALIAEKPGSKGKYYVFTTTEKGGIDGLRYSIVDMYLRKMSSDKSQFDNSKALVPPGLTKNFGLGDVTTKNKILLGSACEKVAITKTKDGKGFWVLSHKWNSNSFYAFKITEDGIMDIPVVTKIGSVHKNYGSANNGEAIGQMKFSLDGSKLAVAICYKPNNFIEVLDFNNETGVLSNLKNIPTGGFGYGVEFSPDNSKLYVSFLKGGLGLKQYDLTAEDIFDAEQNITGQDLKGSILGSLQMGPDKKIYVAKTGNFVGRIENPNALGNASVFNPEAINLGSGNCVYGLPSPIFTASPTKKEKPKVVQSLKIDLGPDIETCAKDISIKPDIANASYKWSNGSSTSSIVVQESGKYWVEVQKGSQIGRDTINVTFSKRKMNITIQDTTVKCQEKILLDAGVKNVNYAWSNGATTKSIEAKNSGYYSVTVSDNECTASKKIYVKFLAKPTKFKYLQAFTPGDPFNNYFAYTLNDVHDFHLRVKNSGGKVIFESKNLKEKWHGIKDNGKFYPEGNYKWEIDYTPECSNKAEHKKGTVKLKSSIN